MVDDRRDGRNRDLFSKAHGFDADLAETFDDAPALFRGLMVRCPVAHSNDFDEHFTLLKDNLARIPAAAEELLRLCTPIARPRARLTRDVEIGGRLIREDEPVARCSASGNRDADVFEDFDTFRIDRRSPHLAFGRRRAARTADADRLDRPARPWHDPRVTLWRRPRLDPRAPRGLLFRPPIRRTTRRTNDIEPVSAHRDGSGTGQQ